MKNKNLGYLFVIGLVVTAVGLISKKFFFLFLVFPLAFNLKKWIYGNKDKR